MNAPVLLAQPVLHGLASTLFGAILVGGLLFGFLGTYTRQETVRGEVAAAGDMSVVATEQAGIVSRVHVRLGQHVAAGQVLATLRPPPVLAASGNNAVLAIARLNAVRANLDEQIRGLRDSISEANHQVAVIEANARTSSRAANANRVASERQRAIAEERLAAFETLARKGYASISTVDQIRASALQSAQGTANADLTAAEIERARADRVISSGSEIRAMRQSLLELSSQKLQIDTQVHALEAQEEMRIVAPAAGSVRAIGVRDGQRVEAAERLFAVARESAAMVATLDVPSSAIGFIERGQRVVLKYDAFPFEAFGLRYGTVTAVQEAPLEQPDQAPTSGKAERVFRVEVAPESVVVEAYGRRRPLRIGMGLTAEIALERRTLISWMLEPLLSLRGRLT